MIWNILIHIYVGIGLLYTGAGLTVLSSERHKYSDAGYAWVVFKGLTLGTLMWPIIEFVYQRGESKQ